MVERAIIPIEVWSDLHHDLIKDPQGKLKKVVNIDAVKTSIDNILRTSKGERVMLRDFGSSLRNMLFENISEDFTDIIADDIKNAINTWDSRVIINSINFKTNVDRNEVNITISFAIPGYQEIFSHSITV